mgnify:CR=1 FL=1
MKRKICRVVLIFILMLPLFIQAQEGNFGNWLIYIGNKKLNQKWNIHNEVQYRNYNVIGDLEQLLLRTGLGYTFNEGKNNVLLGYGYILSENYIGNTNEKVSVNEHRIFQQFTSNQKVGNVKLGHRYRFEQRFVESDFKMRFRYFLSLNIPIGVKEDSTNKFYLSAYNEIFLNTKTSIFDRNRLYGGLGYNINKNIILLDFKSNETPWSIDIYSKKISNIKKILKQNNVHTRDVYPPLNSQKIYKHIKGMPVSNFYCKMGIWLPTSLDLKKSEIIKICKLINQIH